MERRDDLPPGTDPVLKALIEHDRRNLHLRSLPGGVEVYSRQADAIVERVGRPRRELREKFAELDAAIDRHLAECGPAATPAGP